jgi:ATP diphosphatase
MPNAPKMTVENLPADAVERLLAIMQQLRNPDGGCPWDLEQNFATIAPYTIEEAYEVADAIERRDMAALKDELGDLLLQVVFHAEIGAERSEFTIAEVLARLNDKLITRHPHVFGDVRVQTPDQALTQWEAIKQREAEAQGRRRSVIDGVPRALPGLVRAQRIQSKAARVKFDWPDAQAAWAKVEEEVAEASAALAGGDAARIEEELGDMLFSLVNVARLSSLDAEETLQRAIEKFRRRFVTMEDDLNARGTSIASVTPEELERSWQAVKAQEQDR